MHRNCRWSFKQYFYVGAFHTVVNVPWRKVYVRVDKPRQLFTHEVLISFYMRVTAFSKLYMLTQSYGYKVRCVAVQLILCVIEYFPVSSFLYDQRKLTSNIHKALRIGFGWESGVNYWVIKSSCALDWSKKIFMVIIRKRNTCGIFNQIEELKVPKYPNRRFFNYVLHW